MLGRFVCPASRLAELTSHAKLLRSGPPLALCALGRNVTHAEDFLEGMRADLDAMAAFRQQHGDRVILDMLELKLPDEILAHDLTSEFAGIFAEASILIEEEGPPALTLFWEIGFKEEWRKREYDAHLSLRAINVFNLTHKRQRCLPFGVKLRCGGADASAIPTTEQVAFTLANGCHKALKLKCTAGLHHPLRHLDPCTQAKMHGFTNVFAAGVLACARKINEDRIREILEDENPDNFIFDDAGFRWKDLHATTAEIELARENFVTSFGSCSFDEPREDLRRMGWL
jgi:hypothetical protein